MANAIQAPNNIAPRITMVNVTYVKKKGPSLKPGILVICEMAGTLSDLFLPNPLTPKCQLLLYLLMRLKSIHM